MKLAPVTNSNFTALVGAGVFAATLFSDAHPKTLGFQSDRRTFNQVKAEGGGGRTVGGLSALPSWAQPTAGFAKKLVSIRAGCYHQGSPNRLMLLCFGAKLA